MGKRGIHLLQNDLDEAKDKLSFVMNAISQPERTEFQFTAEGQFGLHLILNSVIDEINSVSKKLEFLKRDESKAEINKKI